MKAATIEICYNGSDYKFRCPKCASLNINGEQTASKCPDCGEEFAVPEVEICDCKPKDLTKKGTYHFEILLHGHGDNVKEAWDEAAAGFSEDPGELDPKEVVDFEEDEEGYCPKCGSRFAVHDGDGACPV